QVSDREVAHPDRPRESLVTDLEERLPRLLSQTRHGPVDEVQVNVVEAELAATLLKRLQRGLVALVVVPELRRDENLLAWDPALRMIDAEERVADVLLKPRRVRQRGDVAHLPTVRVDVPVVRDPSPEGGAFDLDPDELSLDALLLHSSERGLPEVVRPFVLV